MGKRKKSSRTPAGPKKKEPLATRFKCVFCNTEDSVTVVIDKKAGIGSLTCKNCHQSFQTSTNSLSAGVDVYYDWIDACDAVANDADGAAAPPQAHPSAPSARAKHTPGLAPGEHMTAEDRDFIEDDEGDAEAEYADEED